jgi:hypothetical protein
LLRNKEEVNEQVENALGVRVKEFGKAGIEKPKTASSNVSSVAIAVIGLVCQKSYQ